MDAPPTCTGEIHLNLDAPPANHPPRLATGRALAILNTNPTRVRTLHDLALSNLSLADFPVVKAWRDKLFQPEGLPEICPELPTLLTEGMRLTENEQHGPSRRAQILRYVLANKSPKVAIDDLLPGSTTTRFVGPVIYVDTIGYCIWPELNTMANRPQNPFRITEETAHKLNREIFPYWLERRTLQEVARYSSYDTADYALAPRNQVKGDAIDPPMKKKAGETPKCQELMERVAFFLSDKTSAVSHTVPDFERLLNHGLQGLAQQMRLDIQNGTATAEGARFLEGVILVFEGAMIYAKNLADAAEACGNHALATICRRVPAQPARTLHEALTSIWICYHLLLQENTNFGLSIGRLDQLLNRYYLSDWEKMADDKAKQNYVCRAVELVCHFFLHCSDHVPLSTEGSETLFAGSGSNQALTVGGVRVEGDKLVDAVNDMTYIILKATELLAIRDPNVHARYHTDIHHRDAADNPLPAGVEDAYLQRICQVNILTRATPAIHGDLPVIEAMSDYYASHQGVSREEALADAADYASIGCIEQNAAGKHYGHTGSTLMVLPAVLELTLFGGKHRGDGIGPEDPGLFDNTKDYTTPPLTEMASMDAFLQAFRLQLDRMACHTVQNNNYLGRTFEKIRPSPFLSGLFTGPTNLPGQHGAHFRDVTAGGAKYNSAGVAIIGLADVIDSLCVIETLVFSGKIGARELLAAMAADFDEAKMAPPLTARRLKEITTLISRTPKYGAGVEDRPDYDNKLAVDMTNRLVRMIDSVFSQYKTHRGGIYLTGYWSMTNHAGFGMLTKATPNGRKSGAAFAGGITPCPGIKKKNGADVTLLDHMLSVAAVDYRAVRNGYTYNLSLTPRGPSLIQEDTRFFANHIKTFMDHKGVLVQLCVSSVADLQEAHKAATTAATKGAGDAEKKALEPFKDLMIRVAGYSAYFVTLSPEMREEIIHRANFPINSGCSSKPVVNG
ncbi:MAG: hypothetical protein H7839_22745 [Magnetococcus sp. YQC-5]